MADRGRREKSRRIGLFESIRRRKALVALCTLGVAAVVLVVWAFMSRLAQGRRMRAVMQNRELAAVSGIPTGRVDTTTFVIGSDAGD